MDGIKTSNQRAKLLNSTGVQPVRDILVILPFLYFIMLS